MCDLIYDVSNIIVVRSCDIGKIGVYGKFVLKIRKERKR